MSVHIEKTLLYTWVSTLPHSLTHSQCEQEWITKMPTFARTRTMWQLELIIKSGVHKRHIKFF